MTPPYELKSTSWERPFKRSNTCAFFDPRQGKFSSARRPTTEEDRDAADVVAAANTPHRDAFAASFMRAMTDDCAATATPYSTIRIFIDASMPGKRQALPGF
jgi:hypothetical protein